MLLGPERPSFLVGQGVRYGGAAADLPHARGALGYPVASSASGSARSTANHPLALGLVARAGPLQANHATRQADVLLALGVRFGRPHIELMSPGYSFTIPPTQLIHVDIDPEEDRTELSGGLGLMADVRTSSPDSWPSLSGRFVYKSAPDSRQKWPTDDHRLTPRMGCLGRARLFG